MKRLGSILILLGGLVLGIALGALILFASGGTLRGKERLLPPTVGSAVPDFRLQDINGSQKRLSDWKGGPLIVNFWATWCQPCREEMPLLEASANQYAGKLTVVGVNYAEDARTVAPFLVDLEITFPILMDLDGQVSNRYFLRSYPATFFVDADGILRAQHIGLLTEDEMDRYLTTIGVKPQP